MKKSTSKRVPLVKTRNAETMTESAFWGFIRSALRQKSRWWLPIAKCKLLVKRPYTGINKRQKYEYLCNHCKKYFPEKKINVDHIVQAGSLTCAADLPGFVERLFCEVQGLQVLCTACHDIKTNLEKKKKL
jgi:5-methylcytosine-specific restriction endonuclease McrA